MNKYSYPDIILWLEKKGVELYGNHFKIVESDYPIIYKLIAYFLKDEQACYQYNINLNKGILLSGPVGCGKTSLMNVMKHLTPTKHKFTIKPCRDISFEFIQDGYQIIHKYSIGKLYESQPKTICYDGLGVGKRSCFVGSDSRNWLLCSSCFKFLPPRPSGTPPKDGNINVCLVLIYHKLLSLPFSLIYF